MIQHRQWQLTLYHRALYDIYLALACIFHPINWGRVDDFLFSAMESVHTAVFEKLKRMFVRWNEGFKLNEKRTLVINISNRQLLPDETSVLEKRK